MRILLNDYAGHAFAYELSTELTRRGHDVHHAYCSTTVAPQGSLSDRRVATHPIGTGRTFSKYHLRKRLVDELKFGWRSVQLARQVKPDIVVTCNFPLISLACVWLACVLSRTTWVLWLQDIQAGLAAMVDRSKVPVARALGVLERWLICRAHHIVTISPEFRDEAVRLGADRRRTTVIENWAPLDELPLRDNDNAWARDHDLADKFVYLYSGTLGIKHNPEALIDLAEAFVDEPDVRVVVVSESVGADWLRDQQADKQLPNLVLLPFQPFERLPDVLGTADTFVVLLDAAAGRFSVPSKTLGYLCAGRPVLAAVPAENAAARLIDEVAEAGITVPPGRTVDLVAAARRLRSDDEMRARFGKNGRNYAERTFDRAVIGDRFEEVLETSIRRP